MRSTSHKFTVLKIPTLKLKAGEDRLKVIVLKAHQIEKEIQAKVGVVVVQDTNCGFYWEQAYFTLASQGNTSPTPQPDTSTKSVGRPCCSKTGSIIDLTALSEDEIPLTQNIATKVEVIVKQDISKVLALKKYL